MIREMGNYELDLYLERLCNKEKRVISMERQQHHEKRLLDVVSHNNTYKPSLWRAFEWDEELGDYVDRDRVKHNGSSHIQKYMKKTSQRRVRHLAPDILPPKGNSYRKVYDYWWTWI